jgi:hypothetical protein
LTVGDFETGLEERLLAARLKHHQTAARADESFAARRTDFERLRVARVVAGRDDLARELASQIRDEGRGLEEVAREHGLPVVRRLLFRKDLGGPLAGPLASAGEGELVGPVATPEGFALVVVEERRPPELDGTTRQVIQDGLFNDWLAGRMSQATLDLGHGRAVCVTEKPLARYPLFRLLLPRQLGDWLAGGQEIDCRAGFTLL